MTQQLQTGAPRHSLGNQQVHVVDSDDEDFWLGGSEQLATQKLPPQQLAKPRGVLVIEDASNGSEDDDDVQIVTSSYKNRPLNLFGASQQLPPGAGAVLLSSPRRSGRLSTEEYASPARRSATLAQPSPNPGSAGGDRLNAGLLSGVAQSAASFFDSIRRSAHSISSGAKNLNLPQRKANETIEAYRERLQDMSPATPPLRSPKRMHTQSLPTSLPVGSSLASLPHISPRNDGKGPAEPEASQVPSRQSSLSRGKRKAAEKRPREADAETSGEPKVEEPILKKLTKKQEAARKAIETKRRKNQLASGAASETGTEVAQVEPPKTTSTAPKPSGKKSQNLQESATVPPPTSPSTAPPSQVQRQRSASPIYTLMQQGPLLGMQLLNAASKTRSRSSTQGSASPEGCKDKKPRSVDKALGDLFPKKFTKKQFFQDAQRVVGGPDNVLKKGRFWNAFRRVQFVGEGAFGFVWKVETKAGDILAVKSSPITFDTPEAIDDGYSVIREVATMRFLNEQNVRCILPLHAAFVSPSSDALPPYVHLATFDEPAFDAAHDEAMNSDVSESDSDEESSDSTINAKSKKGKTKRAPSTAAAKKNSKKANGKKKLPAKSTKKPNQKQAHREPQKALREARLEAKRKARIQERRESLQYDPEKPIVVPSYFAISKEQLQEAGATIFMVTEFCDGDLDTAAFKGNPLVCRDACLSVSAALADMHHLGLVHLDLKPANILYVRKPRVIEMMLEGEPPTGTLSPPKIDGIDDIIVEPLPPSPRPKGKRKSSTNVAASVTSAHSGTLARSFVGQSPTMSVSSSHFRRFPVILPGLTKPTANQRKEFSPSLPSPGARSPPMTCCPPSVAETVAPATVTTECWDTFYFLADFGNTQIVGRQMSDVCEDAVGTYEYMDTLALNKKVCDRSTDCYSLGITLFQLMTGRLLFTCENRAVCEGNHTRSCFIDASRKAPPKPAAIVAEAFGASLGQKGKRRTTAKKTQVVEFDAEESKKVDLDALGVAAASLLAQRRSVRWTASQCFLALSASLPPLVPAEFNDSKEKEQRLMEELPSRGDSPVREPRGKKKK